ncbi:MAG TPA: hypothetical protein VFG21_03300 [Xanthomonadaceae bacterium]|nr:hypothetical protein [Xanthomonadaceae bacterium]
MNRLHVLLAAAALVAVGAPVAAIAASGCASGDAPVLYALVSTPPLLAAQEDASTTIQVRSDGCVVVHAPAWRRDAGTRAFVLSGRELSQLRQEIDGTGVGGIEPETLRADLRRAHVQRKRGELPLVSVSDEPIIELTLTDDSGQRTIHWSSLRQDLANHPDHPDLVAIAATAETLRRLPLGRTLEEVQP